MYIKVKVTPGARKEVCEDKGGNRFVVSVKEKAEGNKATARVLFLIARQVGVSVSKLRILTGHRARNKTLEVLE